MQPTLQRPGRVLLGCGSLVNGGLAASSVFVSLFFYVTSGSLGAMVLYTLGTYVGLSAGFLSIARWLSDTAPRTLVRVGLACDAIFYAVLTLLGHRADALALPLGLFGGVSASVYWMGVNTLAYDVLSPRERGRYYGLSFAIRSVANFVVPPLAGALIVALGVGTGFAAVFVGTLGIFVLAWWVARDIPRTEGVGSVSLRAALPLDPRMPEWRRVWLAIAMRGFKQGSAAIGLIVLVAIATHSAFDQGEFAAIVALGGAGTSVFAGRLGSRARAVGMQLGAAGFAASTVILFFGSGFALLISYGALSSLLYPLLTVPFSAVVLDTMDISPTAGRKRGDYIVSSEVALNAGRVTAVLALAALLSLAPPPVAVIAVLGMAAVLQLGAARLAAGTATRLNPLVLRSA